MSFEQLHISLHNDTTPLPPARPNHFVNHYSELFTSSALDEGVQRFGLRAFTVYHRKEKLRGAVTVNTAEERGKDDNAVGTVRG
ncbi:hypothetical protein E2C01_076278 [Portunus trituberculatus]|uniref:Uncharacterized protein n=1 Tax=Portunus trituberculatus TaxID=210409 RepID=A0A5B7IB17_PORTR|nr:hypothetical protein [Portunus trituberculatus]